VNCTGPDVMPADPQHVQPGHSEKCHNKSHADGPICLEQLLSRCGSQEPPEDEKQERTVVELKLNQALMQLDKCGV
jgi:hypothetical protein